MKTLLDNLLSHASLTAAWRRVWENDGGPGADGVTLETFSQSILSELATLKREVRSETYFPGNLREIELPRPGRQPRLLGVPCVRDRVLQTAAALVISPLIDPEFSPESHAYRPGHSVADAIAQVITARNDGFLWVVDADISDYFDSIPHAALLERLAAALPDNSLHALFEIWLKTPTEVGLSLRPRTGGLPQGAPISPLFSNLYLDRFDKRIAGANQRFVRYADDFVILCQSCDDAENALETADSLLREDGLELNYSKTRLTTFAQGFDFLGIHFAGDTQKALIPDAERWLLPKEYQPVPGLKDEISASAPYVSSQCETLRPLINTVHVAQNGAYLHQRGGRIIVSREQKDLFEIPLEKLDQINVTQEGAISFAALRELLAKKISFVVSGGAGEPSGWLENLSGGNVALHRDQFLRAENKGFCLQSASTFVVGKIKNSRLILRRYARFRPDADATADIDLSILERRAVSAPTLEVLRGLEGAAARRYFAALKILLGETWAFKQRNRRPPRDPVNTLLSYGYAILFQNVLTLVVRRGLHPHVGSLHAQSGDHPALVSDLMEEFRPIVVDAVVLKLCLNQRIHPENFDYNSPEFPCRLDKEGRRIFIQAIETKFDTPIKHPVNGKTTDLRRAIAAQVQHWAEYVTGRTKVYRPYVLH